ncbi:TIGR03089 family protein [Actinomadura flavalba]|uniref:TIGR03089 family protein n=1 Tax=Actinomadura flavalba TaxID=1120938 RepID=UPI00037DF50A|nr:TIGR03089 family protein [Actinomadura flavalba]
MTDPSTHASRLPADLLRARVAADPSRPLVTFYDDATGERVELSARTFDNWVAKTANLLVDELDAGPDGVRRAVLVLPQHWQTAAWLMACWAAGVETEVVDPSAIRSGDGTGEPRPSAEPYLLAVAEEVLDVVLGGELARQADAIVGLSLHALGGPLADAPPDVTDYALEVRSHGDRFAPPPGVAADDPALTVTKVTLNFAGLVRAAGESADKWGFDSSDRVLVAMPFATLDGVLAGLLAPLVSGASVIIQRNFDKTQMERRLALEHVTAVAGLPGRDDASGSVRRLA